MSYGCEWRHGGTANKPMPIIEPSPADSQQLLQGDILQDVRLYATECSWGDDGGRSVRAPQKLCLVLSRPCVAMHKRYVLVAGIEKYPDAVSREEKSFEDVRELLAIMRDGVGAPDVFYLGQLPNKKGRFCARLDAIYCIEVPPEEQALLAFLQKRRVGTLNAEFVRDLHVRVFMAFASLGFTDESWLSDDDLNWLVLTGKREVREAEVELDKAREKKASRGAEGKQSPAKEIEPLEKKLAKLQNQIKPYVTEESRRQKDHPADG